MARKLNLSPKYWLLLGAGVFFILGAVWYVFSRPDKGSGTIPTVSTPTTSSVSQDKQQVASQDASSPSSPPSVATDKNKTSQTNTAVSLKVPYGTFVSNHRPGGSNPTVEASVCNTSPGASCFIKFTKGDVTKTLTSKLADANGSVYWDWDIKDAGFTEGSWQISAVATLGGQEQTAKDSMPLEIQP